MKKENGERGATPNTGLLFSNPEPRTPNPGSLRVLHVIPSVGPLRGGPSETVRLLTRGLMRAGVEVHVATTDDNGSHRIAVPLNSPVTEESGCYHYFRRQTRFYTVSWPLNRWLAQHVRDYALIHIHAVFSFASTAAAYWAYRCHVPYIVRPLGVLNHWGMTNHRAWLKRLSFQWIERRILAHAAAVHCTSEQERHEVRTLGAPHHPMVIPNAVEPPPTRFDVLAERFRADYPQLTGKVVLLFLSRLDVKKGLDLLLPAFAAVYAQYPELRLVLAGNGEATYVAHLQTEAKRLGVDAALVWTGFLAGEDKWAALAAADAFVLPSYSENFGNAVVEAMAVGCPVVITDRVGIHPEVTAARAGIVTSCDVQELSRALVVLASGMGKTSQMGRNGQALVAARFSLEVVTKALLHLYSTIGTTN